MAADDNGGLCLPDTEPYSDIRTPTLANAQQGLSFFSDSQEDRIKMLEHQLEAAELENLELQNLIKGLQGEREGERANLNGHLPQGAPGIDISVDTLGDSNITILHEDSLKVKERFCKLHLSEKDVLEVQPCQHVQLCRVHPESCHSLSMDSVRSRDSVDLSDEISRPVADISNACLAPSGFDVPPSGRVTDTKAAAMAAAAASQRRAFEKLQSESLNKAEGSNTGKEIKGASVTIDMIRWLSENVSWLNWKPLLLELGLSNVAIEEVIKSHPCSIVEQRYQSFLAWKKTHPSGPTVSALLQAMQAKSLQQLSRDFCKHHQLDSGKKLSKKYSVGKLTRQLALEADFDRSRCFCLSSTAEEAPLKNRTCTLQSLQQDLAAFAETKDDTIQELKSELALANRRIQELRMTVDGLPPNTDGSWDDSSIMTLRKENAGLKEQLRQLESMKNSLGKAPLEVRDIKLGRLHPESCPSSVSVESNS